MVKVSYICEICKTIFQDKASAHRKFCSRVCYEIDWTARVAGWNKRTPWTPKVRAKLSRSHMGKTGEAASHKTPHSESTKKILSAKTSALWQDLAYRENMVQKHKGKIRSIEQRQKQSQSMKDLWATKPETFSKMFEMVYSEKFRAERRAYRLTHKIPSKSTKIERLSQESLARHNEPFLVNVSVEGIAEADIQLLNHKILIFADGCYWHSCPVHHPNSLLEKHVHDRDTRITTALIAKGWNVYRVWEHDFKTNPDIVWQVLQPLIGEQKEVIPA
jgi:DNA mismatch endonuclease, patch repair protein